MIDDLTINGQPAASLGITDATITYRSMAEDTLTFTQNKALSEAPLTGTVSASIGDATFTGRIIKPSKSGQGGQSKTHKITAYGKWNDLARTVFQQPLPFDDFDGLDTRVVLGGAWVPDDWSTVDIDPVTRAGLLLVPTPMQDTLAAVAAYAGISITGTAITLKTPPREADGIMCAEALQTMLRWLPGTTASFDGSASTLRITRAGAALTIPVSEILGIPDIAERTDQILPGAKILFRKIRQSPLAQVEVITVSQTGDITAPGAYIDSIDLMPEVHQIEAANLDIANINQSSREWWSEKDTWVADAIEQLGAALVGPTDIEVVREHSSLDHELKGSIPASFENGCTGPLSPAEKIISVGNGTRPRIGEIRVRATFTIGENSQYTRAQQFVREITLLGTSLNNGFTGGQPSLYAREDYRALDPGEDPAEYSALVTSVVAASAALGYQGSVVWKPATVPASLIGRRLLLPGIANDTGCPVYEQSIDCRTWHVTLAFGAPAYLGARDLIELMRTIRELRRPRLASTQTSHRHHNQH